MRGQPFALAACSCVLALYLAACSKQTAEEKAKEMATEKVDMAKGIGDVLQEKGTAAAESVTSGMGKVVKGIERGVEKSGRVAMVSEVARQAGLQVTKVQLASAAPGTQTEAASGTGADPVPAHGLDAYVLTSQDVKGFLKVKVFNALDQEIGRVKLPLAQGAEEGHYVRIPLDPQVDLHAISKVEVDFIAQGNDKPQSK